MSEKWIRLSSKNKHEDLIRKKVKDTETTNEELSKQLSEALEKIDKLTRENAMLSKANEEVQETINQQLSNSTKLIISVDIIKNLKNKVKNISKEKDQIDSAAEDLFERCQMYETQYEQLIKYKENNGTSEWLVTNRKYL